jgi:hypothetical protein
VLEEVADDRIRLNVLRVKIRGLQNRVSGKVKRYAGKRYRRKASTKPSPSEG